jgi:hypothetical protein
MLVLSCLNHTSSPFCSGYFGDRVSQTISPVWASTMILLISANHLARIIGGCKPLVPAKENIFIDGNQAATLVHHQLCGPRTIKILASASLFEKY